MALLSDSNLTQATINQVKMLFMKRFPDLMMKKAWMPEDSLTNEASNQAQLHQDQVSTLVLQPSSQVLLPILTEHLGQDVKSEANSSSQSLLSQCLDPAALVLIQDSSTNKAPNQTQLDQEQASILVLQPSSQPLLPVSAEHLERDVESKEKDTRSKNKNMNHIPLLKKMLIRR